MNRVTCSWKPTSTAPLSSIKQGWADRSKFIHTANSCVSFWRSILSSTEVSVSLVYIVSICISSKSRNACIIFHRWEHISACQLVVTVCTHHSGGIQVAHTRYFGLIPPVTAEWTRSVVWSHFTAVNENVANRNLCRKAVRFCGTITNVFNHMGSKKKSERKENLELQQKWRGEEEYASQPNTLHKDRVISGRLSQQIFRYIGATLII